MINAREVEENKLEEFLRGLTPKERLLAGMVISTKFLYGVGYRSEGQGDQQSASSLKKIAERLRNLTREYADKYDISVERLKEIEKGVYDTETTL